MDDSSHKPLSILLIESSNEIVALVKRTLKKTHLSNRLSLEVFSDAESALLYLQDSSAHLLLLDCDSPFTEPLDTLDLIHRSQPKLPVIALSHCNNQITAKAVQRKAQDYILKSAVTPEVLERAINHVVEQFRWHSEFESLLNNSPDGILVLTLSNRIAFINKAAEDLLDIKAEEAINTPILIPIEEDIDLEYTLQSGIIIKISSTLVGWNGKRSLLVNLQNITDQKKSREERASLATDDAVTGLSNKNLFMRHLQREINYSVGANKSVGLLFIDINYFRNVNESLGHEVGDRLLQAIGERLKHLIRSSDFIGRISSDKFAVIVCNHVNKEGLSGFAKKIIQNLCKKFSINDHELYTGACVGLSIFPEFSGGDANTLINQAETAMYHSKDIGHNQWCFFNDKMWIDASKKVQSRSNLNNIFSNKFCQVAYQPIVNHMGQIIAFEAKIDWLDPTLCMLSDNEIFSIAEDMDLLENIESWFINEICQQAKQWSDKYRHLNFLIPISPSLLIKNDFKDKLLRTIEQQDIFPENITLVISEHHLTEEIKHCTEAIEQLRFAKIRCCIDHFGASTIPLNELLQLPVDFICIDQSVVATMTEQKHNQVLVKTILFLAQEMNFRVIAKGVDTSEQKAFLDQEQCEFMQGVHFHRMAAAKSFDPSQHFN